MRVRVSVSVRGLTKSCKDTLERRATHNRRTSNANANANTNPNETPTRTNDTLKCIFFSVVFLLILVLSVGVGSLEITPLFSRFIALFGQLLTLYVAPCDSLYFALPFLYLFHVLLPHSHSPFTIVLFTLKS